MKSFCLVALAALSTVALTPTAQARVSLLDVSKQVRALATSPTGLTADNCATVLAPMAAQLDAYTSKDFTRAGLRSSAKATIQNLWSSRLAIREKMTAFSEAGTLTPACVSAIRKSFQNLRFLEEYVGVHTLEAGAWVDPKPGRVFAGGFPSVVRAPDVKKIDFQSGDVLVSYGMAYGSAAISHVGDDPGTFSHMALIYKDKTGAVYTIEAHPEYGVKVKPIEVYLTDGKGRSALFRHHDSALAALAARRMYEVAQPRDAAGDAIPYDFSMNLDDHSKLFCTEIVSYAFQMAAAELHQSLTLPAFPTHITLKNRYILDAFGIEARVTFAPSDIEVDPQFKMLAEWRDLPRARLMHHQQAVLEKQFRWLDEISYKYRSDIQTILDSQTLYTTRHLPLFEGLVDTLVPPDLSEKTLEVVVQVYLVSDQIHSGLIEVDKGLEAERGVLMTNSEILSAIEANRQADLALFKTQPHGALSAEAQQAKFLGRAWHWILSADSEWAR